MPTAPWSTSSGYQVEPQITIPANGQSVTVAADGTVSYTLPGQTATQLAGQLQLATFQNPAGLNSVGGNLYPPTDASGRAEHRRARQHHGAGNSPAGLPGTVERFSVVEEFINLIAAQRGYEANSKVVKAADEMYQQVNNIVQ